MLPQSVTTFSSVKIDSKVFCKIKELRHFILYLPIVKYLG